MTLNKRWIDSGRSPRHKPDPAYPNGKPLDVSRGAAKTCQTDLPHPTIRRGFWEVRCDTCKRSILVTTAGRADDPCSIKVDCDYRKTIMGGV